MGLTDLLIAGANASVVVFVVSSTLGVGLRLTVGEILMPLRNFAMLVPLSRVLSGRGRTAERVAETLAPR